MAGENLPGEQFPPAVPCPGVCAYGSCTDPGQHFPAPYGCGGCCRCMGGCRLEWEVEQAMIPETAEQAHQRLRWQADREANVDYPFPL